MTSNFRKTNNKITINEYEEVSIGGSGHNAVYDNIVY